MSERDQFESWWEEWFGEAPMSGWDNLRTDSGYSAEEIDIQWEAWMGRASREALKAEQGEDSDLLSRAKKLNRDARGIVERLKQTSDSGFMFVPVADLYAIWTPGNKAPSYTTDAAAAFDCAKEGWPVDEYVKLERLQDAMNHPIDTTPNQYEALGKGER